jgi:hypothetical protein
VYLLSSSLSHHRRSSLIEKKLLRCITRGFSILWLLLFSSSLSTLCIADSIPNPPPFFIYQNIFCFLF